MRKLGRVMAGLGVGLAAAGGAGAIAMLPPPVLQNAGAVVEGHRQALRGHLPDMPALGELIAGTTETEAAPVCVPSETDTPFSETGNCGEVALPTAGPAPIDESLAGGFTDDEPPPVGAGPLLTRSNEAAKRFRAPVMPEPPAATR